MTSERLLNDNELPITIISGYLGSGKTTLINGLLQQANGLRIAVLVNDFGELAIDANLIEAQYGNVISLSGGCICCSYGNDLTASLLDVQAMDPLPDYVVIETSGVALPGAVASSVSIMSGLSLNGVLVLGNAASLMDKVVDRYVADTVNRQLARADIVILNQCDLASEQQLGQCRRWLSKQFPDTPVIEAINAALPIEVVLGEKLHETRKSSTDNDTDHDPVFTTCVLNDLQGLNLEDIHRLLTDDRYALARAKGYVTDNQGNSCLLQLVGQRLHIAACTAPPAALQNRLVCIGLLDQETIRNLQLEIATLTGR